MTCALYRHFSETGELLYVGMSANPMQRTYAHSANASWFGEVSTIRIERFDSREKARDAELKAIREESPAFNQQGKQNDLLRHKPPKPVRVDPPHIPHPQLDALNRVWCGDDKSLKWKLGCSADEIARIRADGRPLNNVEISAFKNRVGTTYKKLESIGIARDQPKPPEIDPKLVFLVEKFINSVQALKKEGA